MTAPATPYSSSEQVSYLMQTLFLGGTPTHGSVPPVSVIETLISWTDSVIEATFASVGYDVPFSAISGQSWPTGQTNFLSFMSAIGVAAMAGGYVLAPYPTRGMSRGTEETGYARLFEKMRQDVQTTGLGFMASYRIGTRAEKWICEPYGPRLDFLEDLADPTRYSLLKGYTDMILDVYDETPTADWDYTYFVRLASAA